jgi:hypothetical protein
MRIIIDNRDFDSSQRPLVTIDTYNCTYPYAIRNAIKLALELDGYSKETINEVLGSIQQDVCCEEVETFKLE